MQFFPPESTLPFDKLILQICNNAPENEDERNVECSIKHLFNTKAVTN